MTEAPAHPFRRAVLAFAAAAALVNPSTRDAAGGPAVPRRVLPAPSDHESLLASGMTVPISELRPDDFPLLDGVPGRVLDEVYDRRFEFADGVTPPEVSLLDVAGVGPSRAARLAGFLGGDGAGPARPLAIPESPGRARASHRRTAHRSKIADVRRRTPGPR